MWSRQPKFPPWIPPEARGWWPTTTTRRSPALFDGGPQRVHHLRPRSPRAHDDVGMQRLGVGVEPPLGVERDEAQAACRRRARRGPGIRRRGASRCRGPPRAADAAALPLHGLPSRGAPRSPIVVAGHEDRRSRRRRGRGRSARRGAARLPCAPERPRAEGRRDRCCRRGRPPPSARDRPRSAPASALKTGSPGRGRARVADEVQPGLHRRERGRGIGRGRRGRAPVRDGEAAAASAARHADPIAARPGHASHYRANRGRPVHR